MVKGIQVIKKKREELDSARNTIEDLGMCSLETHPEDVLYETELEDMCEQGPSTLGELASQRWHEYSHLPGETVDSTTGEVLDPVKVQDGV